MLSSAFARSSSEESAQRRGSFRAAILVPINPHSSAEIDSFRQGRLLCWPLGLGRTPCNARFQRKARKGVPDPRAVVCSRGELPWAVQPAPRGAHDRRAVYGTRALKVKPHTEGKHAATRNIVVVCDAAREASERIKANPRRRRGKGARKIAGLSRGGPRGQACATPRPHRSAKAPRRQPGHTSSWRCVGAEPNPPCTPTNGRVAWLQDVAPMATVRPVLTCCGRWHHLYPPTPGSPFPKAGSGAVRRTSTHTRRLCYLSCKFANTLVCRPIRPPSAAVPWPPRSKRAPLVAEATALDSAGTSPQMPPTSKPHSVDNDDGTTL